jgi:hypothetical protein
MKETIRYMWQQNIRIDVREVVCGVGQSHIALDSCGLNENSGFRKEMGIYGSD